MYLLALLVSFRRKITYFAFKGLDLHSFDRVNQATRDSRVPARGASQDFRTSNLLIGLGNHFCRSDRVLALHSNCQGACPARGWSFNPSLRADKNVSPFRIPVKLLASRAKSALETSSGLSLCFLHSRLDSSVKNALPSFSSFGLRHTFCSSAIH
jgi:hypothetical protein